MKPANLNGNISIFDFAFLDLHMPVLDGFQVNLLCFKNI